VLVSDLSLHPPFSFRQIAASSSSHLVIDPPVSLREQAFPAPFPPTKEQQSLFTPLTFLREGSSRIFSIGPFFLSRIQYSCGTSPIYFLPHVSLPASPCHLPHRGTFEFLVTTINPHLFHNPLSHSFFSPQGLTPFFLRNDRKSPPLLPLQGDRPRNRHSFSALAMYFFSTRRIPSFLSLPSEWFSPPNECPTSSFFLEKKFRLAFFCERPLLVTLLGMAPVPPPPASTTAFFSRPRKAPFPSNDPFPAIQRAPRPSFSASNVSLRIASLPFVV